MRRQSVVLIVVVLLSILLKVSLSELFIILILSFLVFAFELINSSIEALADALHPKRHKNIERAKDMAAGSVLLISLAALIYGLTVFIPRLIGTYLSLL
jgi:undecaprenol kinase